jgi:hypothetical protein
VSAPAVISENKPKAKLPLKKKVTLEELLVKTYQPNIIQFLLEMANKLKDSDPLVRENVADELREDARNQTVHNKLRELADMLLIREVTADFVDWEQPDSNGTQSYMQVTLCVKGLKSAHCPTLPTGGRMTPPIMRQCFTHNAPTNLEVIMQIACSSMIYLEANPEFRLTPAMYAKRDSLLNLPV